MARHETPRILFHSFDSFIHITTRFRSFIYSSAVFCLFIRTFIHSFIHSTICPSVRPSNHSFPSREEIRPCLHQFKFELLATGYAYTTLESIRKRSTTTFTKRNDSEIFARSFSRYPADWLSGAREINFKTPIKKIDKREKENKSTVEAVQIFKDAPRDLRPSLYLD